MVKNNQINQEDLREAPKEKARLAKQETAEMKVRGAEKEERDGLIL